MLSIHPLLFALPHLLAIVLSPALSGQLSPHSSPGLHPQDCPTTLLVSPLVSLLRECTACRMLSSLRCSSSALLHMRVSLPLCVILPSLLECVTILNHFCTSRLLFDVIVQDVLRFFLY